MYQSRSSKMKGLYILIIVLAVIAVVVGAFMSRSEKGENPDASGNETLPPDAIETPPESPIPEEVAPEDMDEYFNHTYFPIDTEGQYRNTVLSISSRTGGTFSIGIDDESVADALYLNPRYNPSDEEIAKAMQAGNSDMLTYGVYVKASEPTIVYSDENGAPVDDSKNLNDYNFVIVGQTYDTLIPSSFVSKDDFGVKWYRDPDSPDFALDALITFRVVSLWDGGLVDVFHAKVTYDGVLSITELTRGDVSVTEELSKDERNAIITEAVDFICDTDRGPVFSMVYDDLNSSKGDIIVEHAPATYFNRLLTEKNEMAAAGRFSNCDVYAVNIPQPGLGFVTVYFAPALQLSGMLSQTAPGETDKHLTLFGYDVLMPFSKSTLAIPPEYADYFA